VAVKQATVTVATTATLIFTATVHGFLTVHNEDAAIKVFIGGPTVTNSGATAGLGLANAAAQPVQIPLFIGESVFAAAASGTPLVSYVFSS
jgi:hypothetical protein